MIALLLVSEGAFTNEVNAWRMPWNQLWFLRRQQSTLFVVVFEAATHVACLACAFTQRPWPCEREMVTWQQFQSLFARMEQVPVAPLLVMLRE